MRHFATFRLFGFITCSLVMSGCVSERAAKEFGTQVGEAVAAPLNVIARSKSDSLELAYATASFQRKRGRWPQDYAELSSFVNQSDGLLYLGEYERVDFSELSDGGLQVAFVSLGHTNQGTLKFSSKESERK